MGIRVGWLKTVRAEYKSKSTAKRTVFMFFLRTLNFVIVDTKDNLQTRTILQKVKAGQARVDWGMVAPGKGLEPLRAKAHWLACPFWHCPFCANLDLEASAITTPPPRLNSKDYGLWLKTFQSSRQKNLIAIPEMLSIHRRKRAYRAAEVKPQDPPNLRCVHKPALETQSLPKFVA